MAQYITNEWAVAQWCNPVTVQPEYQAEKGSIPRGTLSLEQHDKTGSIRSSLLLRSQQIELKTATSPSPIVASFSQWRLETLHSWRMRKMSH